MIQFRSFYLSSVIALGALLVAMPAQAEEIDGIQFEMSESFAAVDAEQAFSSPSVAQQPRVKFFDSEDGQWNAGFGVAMMPDYLVNNITSNNTYSPEKAAGFVSIRYQFRQNND